MNWWDLVRNAGGAFLVEHGVLAVLQGRGAAARKVPTVTA
jgi:hypothetical protein